LSTQSESRHYLKLGDAVEHVLGRSGVVLESFALYAVVRWDDGRHEEVDQLDPTISVTDRATKE
jgi:hypothetical protein